VRGTPVGEALDGAVTAIKAAGCETPRLDAEVLLAHVLGVPRERLLLDRQLIVEGQAVRAFQNAVRRRAVEREPVAYITGLRGFRHIDLMVDRRALIPRPETEHLVESALNLPEGSHVLDVCTGSGAVALALKHERDDLQLTGSDISSQALELAAANGARLGLEVQWLQADLLHGVPEEFEAVLCNPPYVSEAQRSELAPEILRHEPPLALFAAADGMATIASLLEQLSSRPRVKLMSVEVGHGQAQRVSELTRAAGFDAILVEPDLAGIERVVVGERTQ
jgi:release factor glutamine methyltransferase